MANAVNYQLNIKSPDDNIEDVEEEELVRRKQHDVALIAEMYHTSSLYHDDVLDKAELRRAKTSVNHLWGQRSSVYGGIFTLCVSNKMLAQIRDPEVSIYCTYYLV